MSHPGLSARLTFPNRQGLLSDVVRLATCLNYTHRMRRAGVPEKRIRQIASRWRPWTWARRQEMAALIADLHARRPA